MDDPDTYKKIEKFTNQYVKEHILETIKKVQKKYGVDIFGFGEVDCPTGLQKLQESPRSLG